MPRTGTPIPVRDPKTHVVTYRPFYWDHIPHSDSRGDDCSEVRTIAEHASDEELQKELSRVGYQPTHPEITEEDLVACIDRGMSADAISKRLKITKRVVIEKAKHFGLGDELYANSERKSERKHASC